MQMKSCNTFCIATTIVFLIITSSSVAADTLVVSNNASANYSTLQAAIDAANNGDTILVYPGIYIENVNVNKAITI